ncbi:sodium:proton antiporter [bacterium]|jgi:NhaP-type Na+/H+ or K+/H+ antiporter|nr:sodium:proton antiporter [bacterium]MBT4928273.1 sodium:proton antiporter [bacterium]MBT6018397.1 sodium:proton antiporter [bacterium]
MHNPALTIGLSMVLGMLAQVGSKHLHLPGIVLLLLSGILFGPDGLNWIDPASIGPGLHILVGFAVAIILFEGGMNLRISRIMRERRAIRGLIIKGALVTFIGGTFITIVVLGWDFRTSILFGTLIVVTGPTVITPLLKRIRVHHGVSTILEAEGILLDAIGAIIAVVALEIAISPSGLSFVTGLFHIISRLGVGAVLGISGGYLLTVMFRFRDLVPDGLENVFILSWVIALFQISNTISPESGIAAVTIAGMTIGNSKTYIQQDLLEFKEQLTVLMIGMLFILLSADVRIEQIIALGVPGLITVAMLIFLIRPLSVFIGTDKSGLALNQKLLLSWIAPRGIVAAAVASLFVYELEIHGYDGTPLRALVFLLIIVTVLLAGLTGGFVAGRLNLRRKSQSGWIILGAHEIARLLSGILKKAGNDIICIDEDPNACLKAENEGLKVFFGNALDDRTLQRAEPDTRKGIIALSGNEEVNYIFSQRAKHLSKEMSILIGIKDSHEGITPKMIVEAGGKIPFGHSADMDFWSSLVKQSLTYQKSYVYRFDKIFDLSDETIKGFLLPMVLKQKKSLEPIDNTMKIKSGNQITFLINKKNEEKATDWLKENGFESASNRT